MLIYVGNITGKIEKKNSFLKQKILLIQDKVNVNEIEYTFYNSYDYLKKLQKIYFSEENSSSLNNRISFYDLKKKFENFHTVGTR